LKPVYQDFKSLDWVSLSYGLLKHEEVSVRENTVETYARFMLPDATYTGLFFDIDHY